MFDQKAIQSICKLTLKSTRNTVFIRNFQHFHAKSFQFVQTMRTTVAVDDGPKINGIYYFYINESDEDKEFSKDIYQLHHHCCHCPKVDHQHNPKGQSNQLHHQTRKIEMSKLKNLHSRVSCVCSTVGYHGHDRCCRDHIKGKFEWTFCKKSINLRINEKWNLSVKHGLYICIESISFLI